MTRLTHVELTNLFGRVYTLDDLLNPVLSVAHRRVGLGRNTFNDESPFTGEGKSATSRIKIPTGDVSKTHALLEYDSSSDRMVVIDLDSTNGTRVERKEGNHSSIVRNVKSGERFPLQDKDKIYLGSEYYFKYHEVRK